MAATADDGAATDTPAEPPWQPTMMDQASWLAAQESPLAAAKSPAFE